jgi:hypothetical protein
MKKANLLRVGAVVVGIGAVNGLILTSSQAVFSDATSNADNTWAAGSVVLDDDDDGNVMFAVSGLKPGDAETRCINVVYTGDIEADVKLFGSVTGDLAPHLDIAIEGGSGAAGGTSFDCTGFGGGVGVFGTDTLAAFGSGHTDWSSGILVLDDVTGAPTPEVRSFRVTVELGGDTPNSAQGADATATFVWEARNT